MREDIVRNWVSVAFVTFLLVSVACESGPKVDGSDADLVLQGGRVVTMDDRLAEAEAVAVKGPDILAVGSIDEILELIGPETRVIDLEGRLVIPGFIEGHGHFMGLGHAKTVLDLTQARSWDEIVEMVGEAAGAAIPGTWVLGRGWHQEKWDSPPQPAVEGSPLHHELSRVSPDNPVILGHASGHAAFANALAMEIAGLTRASEDPAGGQLVRDQHGGLTGLLRETAQRSVWAAVEQGRSTLSLEEIEAENRRLVALAGEEALSKGVTSFHDAGVSFETLDFYRRLEAEGELPIRLYAMVRYASNEEMESRLPEYRSIFEGNDFLTIRSIKRQIDGALGAHGAWLLEPYEDLPDSIGLVLEPEEEILRTAEIAAEHGFQVNTHAIGDRANRRVLDLYEEVLTHTPQGSELRWRIEHAQHLHPEDVPRFAELGVIASMQGIHCTSDAPWVIKRLGTPRAEEGAYLWRTLIDSGAVVTNGTDVPVEDIDPLASFYASVSRRMPDGGRFYPDQRMSRLEALRSYTVNNAYAAFEEDFKGSIEVGKLADLLILSQDILAVAEEQIPDSVVDVTIVGGEVRYERRP